MVHPSQLEEKFGGTAPNVTQYWPPHFPDSTEYGHDPDSLVSEEEYLEILKHNPFLSPRPDIKAKMDAEKYEREHDQQVENDLLRSFEIHNSNDDPEDLLKLKAI